MAAIQVLGILSAFCVCLGSIQAQTCRVAVAEGSEAPAPADPLQDLAREQHEILLHHFSVYFGDMFRAKGFPIKIHALSEAQVDTLIDEYADDLRRSGSGGGTLRGSTWNLSLVFGTSEVVSRQFVEDLFMIYYTQWNLAKALFHYRHEVGFSLRPSQLPTSISKHSRRDIYHRALAAVPFYAGTGMSDEQAFGISISTVKLSTIEEFRLLTKAPQAIKTFYERYQRLALSLGIPEGRENGYYAALLRARWAKAMPLPKINNQ